MTQCQKCDYLASPKKICAKCCTLVWQGPVH